MPTRPTDTMPAMARFEDAVAAYCARHDLLPAGEPLLAMVSGGADSMCLMHLLTRIHDGPVRVLTVHHGLRPEASGEVEAVLARARALGLQAERRDLGLSDGPDLQARARVARLDAAEQVADAHGCRVIATGHTASDQAETVLFRLARGTGPVGAIGMAPRRGRLVRPLLGATRAETRDWCARQAIVTFDDPSNADPRFTRTRVRDDLVPALERVHRGAQRNVAAFADRLRDEATLIDETVAAAWRRCRGEGGLSVSELRAEAPALQRLLLRRAAAEAGLPAAARESRHLERMRGLLGRPGAIELPGGDARVVDGQLMMAPRAAQEVR